MSEQKRFALLECGHKVARPWLGPPFLLDFVRCPECDRPERTIAIAWFEEDALPKPIVVPPA